MSITPVANDPAAASAQQPAAANAATPQLTPANVPATALQAATSDGDGRTGMAALNDGDAAARAARQQAFDVKA